jgi:MscS family membrane protein
MDIFDPAYIKELIPWESSLFLFLTVLILRFFFRKLFTYLLNLLKGRFQLENTTDILRAIDKPIQFFLLILSIYVLAAFSPLKIIATHPSLDKILRSAVLFSVFWTAYNICDAGEGLFLQILNQTGLNWDRALTKILSTVLRLLIMFFAFVMIAKEWGYDITAFVASLGIGSLAVAFAAKDTLADILGSLSVLVQKPFVIGDWVKINNTEGIVESIGFRSTCIRTFERELVYIPNALLTGGPIINYTRRERRRIEYTLGLTYNTTSAQMKQTIEDIRKYLHDDAGISDEDYFVHFFSFGDSALNIRIVCYTAETDATIYFNTREKFNFALMQILEKNGVSCAFPSTSLYFENTLETHKKEIPTPPQP